MSLGDLRRELSRSVRTLLREQAYSLVVILTLALGVGANTAVFTVLDSVLLEPLPYPDPDQLVRIYDVWSENPGELNDYLRSPAIAAYREWEEVFQGVGTLYTYRETGVDITDGDQPERIVASRVSAGYFEMLGLSPILGRTFLPEESFGPGIRNLSSIGAPVALLSHSLWVRQFGSDQEILGRTIRLDDESYEVIGVMPAGVTNPIGRKPDLWIPEDLRSTGGPQGGWGNHYLTGIGRLRPGLTVEAAQERVDALNDRLTEEHPNNEGWQLTLLPLHADLVGSERRALLWILAVAVGLVLLSACVNLANLVFARSLGRERDLALRSALGSGRAQIVLHLLSETGLLALAGGLTGLVVGTVGIHFLLGLAPDALPQTAAPDLNARVFGFALASTLAAVLAFGLAPAVRISRNPPAEVLRTGGRSGTETTGLKRLRTSLAVAQVAVAVTLVAGASLLLKSFQELRAVDLGFVDEGVLTFDVHLPTPRYDGEARARFHEVFQNRIRELPGVEAVGATSWIPANGRYHSWNLVTSPGWDGVTQPEAPAREETDVRVISGDYFRSMGIDLIRGVSPAEADLAGPPVVWVNRMVAETVFPNLEPLGQFVFVGGQARQVVGVVEDTPFNARGELSRITYIPHLDFANNRNWTLIQVVKAKGGLTNVLDEIRGSLAAEDGSLVVYRPKPLSSFLDVARSQERFAALLMTLFAGLALTLAVVGCYGVMAATVARQRRELGIRLAIGAAPGSLRAMVLASSLRLSLAGVALGTATAWWGSRFLADLLFQVEPGDPMALLAGGGVLLALGALSGWIPARKATRVDPVETLGDA